MVEKPSVTQWILSARSKKGIGRLPEPKTTITPPRVRNVCVLRFDRAKFITIFPIEMAEGHGIPHGDTATQSERRGASSVPSPPGLWMSWSEAPGGAPELTSGNDLSPC